MLLNAKLNDKYQKMLLAEAVHTCERIRNSMATTGSNTSPLKIFYGEKAKIIGSFLELRCIEYVTKQHNFKMQTENKAFKAIMVGYDRNYMRDA